MTPTDVISTGPHDLQEVAVWLPSHLTSTTIWVIFIHGGAWRDPSITHIDYAVPAIRELPNTLAFASISYRLSVHPNHPQETDTPSNELRAARHPDHIEDVTTALDVLHKKYKLVSDCTIMIGHSCGTTLAFQAISDEFRQNRYPVPTRIVSLAGIYSIGGIVDRHADSKWASVYREFITGAFGNDEDQWKILSPAQGLVGNGWDDVQVVLCIADSDSLVEPEQKDDMIKALADTQTYYVTMSVEGDHDEMWQVGARQAAAVIRALEL